jgi:hypothetical protein
MAIDYTALASEINNDPLSLGYATHVASGNDIAIAELLNNILSNNPVNTGRINAEVFKRCIPLAAFTSLTQAQREWVNLISATDYIDLNDSQIKNGLTGTNGLFPNTSTGSALTARNEINNASTRNGSRAETLFGVNTFITDMDVARALRPSAFTTQE